MTGRLREEQDLRRTVRRLSRRVERLEEVLRVVLMKETRWNEIEQAFLEETGAGSLAEAEQAIDEGIPEDAFDAFLRSLTPEQWEDMQRGD